MNGNQGARLGNSVLGYYYYYRLSRDIPVCLETADTQQNELIRAVAVLSLNQHRSWPLSEQAFASDQNWTRAVLIRCLLEMGGWGAVSINWPLGDCSWRGVTSWRPLFSSDTQVRVCVRACACVVCEGAEGGGSGVGGGD